MRIEASAPGKLLLLGEYAVLEGAPALVMAVNRRVQVRFACGAAGAARLTAPQLDLNDVPLRWTGQGLDAGAAGERLGMTGRLLPRLLQRLGIEAEDVSGCALEINSAALFSEPKPAAAGLAAPIKLGLGSSAAVAAALIVAFEALSGRALSPPAERLQQWLPIYRDALGADASGADLAASLAGGLIRYRSPAAGDVVMTPVAWPEELAWQALWVGRSAQTVDFVAALRDWQQRDPAAATEVLGRMTVLAEGLAERTNAAGWIEVFDAFAEQLELLGEGLGRAVLSAPHRALRSLAQRHGVVYKSCGAGGGDLGIGLAHDPERVAAFAAAARRVGAVPLKLQTDPRGALAQLDGARRRGVELIRV